MYGKITFTLPGLSSSTAWHSGSVSEDNDDDDATTDVRGGDLYVGDMCAK